MTTHTDNIILRAAEPADVDTLYIWENDESNWRVGITTAPLSHYCIDQYVRTTKADIYAERQLRLIIALADNSEAVGTIDLCDYNPHDSRAQMGIFIAPKYRRRGYARQALALLDRYVCDTLHIHQLWALAATDNTPSQALLRSCGYSAAGRLHHWLRRPDHTFADVDIFQRLFT